MFQQESGNVANFDNQNNEVIEKSTGHRDKLQLSQQPSSRFGSICWLNMIPTNTNSLPRDTAPTLPTMAAKSSESGLSGNSFVQPSSASPVGSETVNNSCCSRLMNRILTVIRWVFHDFQLKHLVWIKLIFFFQSASMTGFVVFEKTSINFSVKPFFCLFVGCYSLTTEH